MDLKSIWRLWAKSIGEKASGCDKESDKVASIRTIIFFSYLITNFFIIYGVTKTHIINSNSPKTFCDESK